MYRWLVVASLSVKPNASSNAVIFRKQSKVKKNQIWLSEDYVFSSHKIGDRSTTNFFTSMFQNGQVIFLIDRLTLWNEFMNYDFGDFTIFTECLVPL